jgi:hypothetical protein
MKIKEFVRNLIIFFSPILDIIFSPITLLTSLWFRYIREAGLPKMPISRKILHLVGVFPIKDHYYEPLFNPKYLTKPLHDRNLPGLKLNDMEQLELLNKFNYNDELIKFSVNRKREGEYYYNNNKFTVGDAEILYSMIRLYKPKRIIEIGSGMSTLIAIEAVKKNYEENSKYKCNHVCIEPYPGKWLREKNNITLIEKTLEDVNLNILNELNENDILFIDSTHVIKPQGDVLVEYLEILPILSKGVIIHIHDIFTPRNYPDEWIKDMVVFWNEQYLFEAVLSSTKEYEVMLALNYLYYNYKEKLESKCPILKSNFVKEPRSFWIKKI